MISAYQVAPKMAAGICVNGVKMGSEMGFSTNGQFV